VSDAETPDARRFVPLGVAAAVIAISLGACAGPIASPVVISGVDMIKASDEADLVSLADAVAVVQVAATPEPRALGSDGLFADYFLPVDVVETLSGKDVGKKTTIQWLGVSPDIGSYVAEPDLEPLGKVMIQGKTYVVFLFIADLPETYNVVGHLQGVYEVDEAGMLRSGEGALSGFDGLKLTELPMRLAELESGSD
jgi:hypothetical protein